MLFSDLSLLPELLKAVSKEGYTTPTPIQEEAIPYVLANKDLIGIAQTGTGKTAAFVLPLLQQLIKHDVKRKKKSPQALILAPTRELAAQIAQSCATYGQFTSMNHAVVFGGVGQNPQVKAIAQGVNILVATPGRLIDLLEQRHIVLDQVQTFVLDEADRMLDMGFVRDIKKLLKYLPKSRQTIMFSATMSPEITTLTKEFLYDPVRVEVTPEGSTVDRIYQELFFVNKTDKVSLLVHIMSQKPDHVLVFSRTKHGADKIARALNKYGVLAQAIHGNKSQSHRTKVLEQFQKGKIVLVATDIAARGIDVDGISHVINFDLPNEAENYVHRIGRTARAGADGFAYSFCDETEKSYLLAIEKVIGQKIPMAKHPFHSNFAMNSTQKPLARGSNRNNRKPQGKKPKK